MYVFKYVPHVCMKLLPDKSFSFDALPASSSSKLISYIDVSWIAFIVYTV